MGERYSNMWDDLVERQKPFIRELIEARGIPPEEIIFYEWWCVFPYKGLWIQIFIENRLKVKIYLFPKGSKFEKVLMAPHSAEDLEKISEFQKRDWHCNENREEAIKEIFNGAAAVRIQKD